MARRKRNVPAIPSLPTANPSVAANPSLPTANPSLPTANPSGPTANPSVAANAGVLTYSNVTATPFIPLSKL